jgi:hypothetical protein
MNRAGVQTGPQSVEANIPATEHDLAHGIVIRQHADDHLTVKQVTDIRCGPETECLELALLIRAANIGDHPPSIGREVGCHRRSHATEAHETDFT